MYYVTNSSGSSCEKTTNVHDAYGILVSSDTAEVLAGECCAAYLEGEAPINANLKACDVVY